MNETDYLFFLALYSQINYEWQNGNARINDNIEEVSREFLSNPTIMLLSQYEDIINTAGDSYAAVLKKQLNTTPKKVVLSSLATQAFIFAQAYSPFSGKSALDVYTSFILKIINKTDIHF